MSSVERGKVEAVLSWPVEIRERRFTVGRNDQVTDFLKFSYWEVSAPARWGLPAMVALGHSREAARGALQEVLESRVSSVVFKVEGGTPPKEE